MGTGLHLKIETECLPSGFFSIRLTEAIPIMSEREECGLWRVSFILARKLDPSLSRLGSSSLSVRLRGGYPLSPRVTPTT